MQPSRKERRYLRPRRWHYCGGSTLRQLICRMLLAEPLSRSSPVTGAFFPGKLLPAPSDRPSRGRKDLPVGREPRVHDLFGPLLSSLLLQAFRQGLLFPRVGHCEVLRGLPLGVQKKNAPNVIAKERSDCGNLNCPQNQPCFHDIARISAIWDSSRSIPNPGRSGSSSIPSTGRG